MKDRNPSRIRACYQLTGDIFALLETILQREESKCLPIELITIPVSTWHA